jgi:hypothetical protein
MTVLVVIITVWVVFATLRHAAGPHYMYIGRHHVAGEF